MALNDDLSQDLKRAMKSRDQLRVDVIRMIKAAAQRKELELNKHLDDAEMTKLMSTLIKQRKEAIEHYQQANRTDLADKELKEISIIEGYLPKAPSEDELKRLIQQVVSELHAQSTKDMGRVMKEVMARLEGLPTEGKVVSELVKQYLPSHSA